MAFLDNSGDIILDAVLTDAGRKRMAEGKFNIAKYAFGDEEINYELFNNNHPSGSAFYDLQIMQTPILEAFTNNTSTMSSKLMTLNDNNFLYLPTLKLNEVWGRPAGNNADATAVHNFSQPCLQAAHSGSYVVTVDSNTEDLFKYTNNNQKSLATDIVLYPHGLILGASVDSGMNGGFICVDQGIGGTQQGLSLASDFPDELRETAYMIRIDNRLGRIVQPSSAPRRIGTGAGEAIAPDALAANTRTERVDGNVDAAHSADVVARPVQSYAFVDDDNMATYYVTTQQTGMLISDVKSTFNASTFPGADLLSAAGVTTATDEWKGRMVFKDGPVGSRLMFSIKAQDTVASSYDLFGTNTKTLERAALESASNQAGTAAVLQADANNEGVITVRYIDTTVSVVGVTTGYRVDIPVRFVKRTS